MEEATFDYSTVTKETASFLFQRADEIRRTLKRTAEDIIFIGDALIQAKELLPHGAFSKWIQVELGMSDRHARNFMHVASRFKEKTEIISALPLTVLYELASPSTPDYLVEEVERGTITATVEAIRELKQEEHPQFSDKISYEHVAFNSIGVKKNLAHLMSESNEWYTPQIYIEAVHELMGGIDVDPASCEIANKTVKAAMYYDTCSNGLDNHWYGRVWLNPPYGKDGGESNQEVWSRKLIEEYKCGVTTEAVLLVNAVTDRKWFQPLWEFLICFTDHRISFYTVKGESQDAPTNGSAFVYFGEQRRTFTQLFRKFGAIVQSVN